MALVILEHLPFYTILTPLAICHLLKLSNQIIKTLVVFKKPLSVLLYCFNYFIQWLPSFIDHFDFLFMTVGPPDANLS